VPQQSMEPAHDLISAVLDMYHLVSYLDVVAFYQIAKERRLAICERHDEDTLLATLTEVVSLAQRYKDSPLIRQVTVRSVL